MASSSAGTSPEMTGPSLVERLWPVFDADWIVYRDEDLIVVDKPAGIACQAADESRPDDLVSRLRTHLANERGVPAADVYLGVHQRLDQGTSGLVLYALRREANPALARQFEERTVRKHYVAVVEPYAGGDARVLEHNLAPGRDGMMRVVPRGDRRGKHARSELRVIRRDGPRALLAMQLHTGRTHQLRVQLAELDAPIVGDRMYGRIAAPRLMLHSHRLELLHPSDGTPLKLEAPLPSSFTREMTRGHATRRQEGATEFDLDVLDDALTHACHARYALGHARLDGEPTTAFRLLHGAADGTPGVAVDVYDRFAVLHLSSPSAEAQQSALIERIAALGFDGIYLKRHPRQKNDLSPEAQADLCPPQPVWGRAADDPLIIHEHGVPLAVRLGDRFSTGIFLDQRDNRRRFAERAAGKRVLNLFAYTGGFSIAALQAGAAEAVCVDTSRAALARAMDNAARIGAADRHRTIAMDAFEALPMLLRKQATFDLIALDPPSYATARKRRFVLTRDYVELCALTLSLLAPGGSLLACVNHHGVSQQQLRRFVHAAAEQAGVELGSLRDLPGPRDFPVEPGKQPTAKQLWASRPGPR